MWPLKSDIIFPMDYSKIIYAISLIATGWWLAKMPPRDAISLVAAFFVMLLSCIGVMKLKLVADTSNWLGLVVGGIAAVSFLAGFLLFKGLLGRIRWDRETN
jgi:hypothetical protein